MSDADELEDIRRRKRERLEAKLRDGDAAAGAADESGVPDEPIRVEGSDHFADVIESYDVVLADFYADWCGPCQMLEPTVETLAAKTDAAVAKVDVDAHQTLASQYRVQGVPTMLLFSGGDPTERVVGVRDEATLAALIRDA
ncbi:thioredoxin family protein [Haloplanus sp. GCM10025708]|uniref:thioredoxin family protein n=1 Tax=Haloferacaceae TaxID=1644056 RepID=UPI003607FD53